MFLRNALTGNALEQFVDLFDLTNSYANDSYVFNFMSLAYSKCLSHENGQKCRSLCKHI